MPENRKDNGKRTRSRARSITWTAAKIFISILLIIITTGAICATVFAIYVANNIDTSLDLSFAAMQLNYTSIIYYTDENGAEQELQRLHGEQNREWVDYAHIPEYLKKAIVAIEDERFWTHNGVDWTRTAGAMANLIFGMNSSYGGSTITQQLIKNITGDNDVTVQRKIQEILRALDLENNMSKEKILELYLNTINLSQGCYGVQTASRLYFGKDVSELNLAECASLAGITNLPSYYDPFNFPENNIKRQKDILWKMHDLGIITDAEYSSAKAQELTFLRDTEIDGGETEEVQSYFVDLLIDNVVSDLMTQMGVTKQVATRLVYSGGLKIYATVNPKVQSTLEDVYTNSENFPRLAGTTQPQSAMTVMSPSGDILGVVGGKGAKQGARVLNRAKSLRQPGSAIKPLTSYIPALEYGLITPYTVMDDTPSMYVTPSGMLVDPQKYDGEIRAWPTNYYAPYKGLMTVNRAVELSSNTIPVRLVAQLGLDKSFSYAVDRFGLSSLDPSENADMTYAPLALGGLTKGVSEIQLTAAYASLTNGGIYTAPRSYTKILDNQSKPIIDNIPRTNVAMSEKTAYYMTHMLQNAATVGTAAKARIDGIATAGKTGTTSADKDRWFVGYTPYYTATVWYGYDTPKEISGVSGNPALNLWKLVMDKLHEGLPEAEFKTPGSLVKASYCMDSGGVPGELCGADARGNRIATGYFFPEDVPSSQCKAHVPIVYDSSNGYLVTPYCPAENVAKTSLPYLRRDFAVGGINIADTEYIAEMLTLPSHYASVAYNQNYVQTGDTPYVYRGGKYRYFCVDHITANVPAPPESEMPPESEVPPESEITPEPWPDEGAPSEPEVTPPDEGTLPITPENTPPDGATPETETGETPRVW